MPREKSSYRDRRSSSYSSESSYEKKKSKSKHKRRSRSRDRSVASSHKSKSSSHRHRRRSYSRSLSRDRYESRSRRRSSSRPRAKRARRSVSRSPSRNRARRSVSRSPSRNRAKHSKTSKKSRRRSRSRSTSSHSSSFDIEPASSFKSVRLDDTETKVEQAIKAAEAAGLTMTKIPTYEYPEVEVKEEMPTIHDRNLLAELNSDLFIQRPFTSSKNKKQNQNIVIDLDSETVKVPNSDIKVNKYDDTILNLDEIPCEEELREMWIKKLYQYRKRMLRGEI